MWMKAKKRLVTKTALVISFQYVSKKCCKNPLNNNSSPKGAIITTAMNSKMKPSVVSGCNAPLRSNI